MISAYAPGWRESLQFCDRRAAVGGRRHGRRQCRTHAGIRRAIGTPQAAKAPAVVTDLKRMLGKLPATRIGLRDLGLLGFAGAFRRSELVALDVADLEFSSAGLVVTLGRARPTTRALSPTWHPLWLQRKELPDALAAGLGLETTAD